MADNKPKAMPYVLDAPGPRAEPKTPAGPAPVVTNADLLDTPIEDLELSVRTANCMLNADILYIGELVQKTEDELLRTKNFGRKSIVELSEILSDMGLRFDMDVGNWQPPEE